MVAFLAVLVSTWSPATAATPQVSDSVYVAGRLQGYPGSALEGIFVTTPSDPQHPGRPDYWAYCVEHDLAAQTHLTGTVQDPSAYLGSNYFTDPAIQGKVLWLLAHSYPRMTLSAFGAAAGVPGISASDAIEATQYAIWRYTELTYDAPWSWTDGDSESA
jgi:TQXA domain-containing protein